MPPKLPAMSASGAQRGCPVALPRPPAKVHSCAAHARLQQARQRRHFLALHGAGSRGQGARRGWLPASQSSGQSLQSAGGEGDRPLSAQSRFRLTLGPIVMTTLLPPPAHARPKHSGRGWMTWGRGGRRARQGWGWAGERKRRQSQTSAEGSGRSAPHPSPRLGRCGAWPCPCIDRNPQAGQLTRSGRRSGRTALARHAARWAAGGGGSP